MLLVNQIRENFTGVLAGLQKRNFPNAEAVLNQAVSLD
jgi:seryl-tRNA synthetase